MSTEKTIERGGDWRPCCGYFVFDDEVCECEKHREGGGDG
jgi:hypothetical protein